MAFRESGFKVQEADNRSQVLVVRHDRVGAVGGEVLVFERIQLAGAMNFVAGDAEAYRYLVESIRRFPRPNDFADMMRAAGFARVSFRRMSGGIVALHSGWRL